MTHHARAVRRLRDCLRQLAATTNAADVFARSSDGKVPVESLQELAAVVAQAEQAVRHCQVKLWHRCHGSRRTRKPKSKAKPERLPPKWPPLVPDLNGEQGE